MRYYARITMRSDEGVIRERFLNMGADENKMILDDQAKQKSAGSRYVGLKEELSKTGESLTVDSLFSFGKNAREITKELGWFKGHGIEIYILDVPSTLERGARNVDLLYDVNALFAAREIEKLKAGQKKAAKAEKKAGKSRARSTGRPRVPYPDNWIEEYGRWQRKETTSAQFRENVGLSQGTFYNFLRQYKEELLYQKEEAKEQA